MAAPELENILGREQYHELCVVAEEEGRSVEDVLREAVLYALRRRPSVDLTKDPAFGIWKGDPRSDEELLSELGGCWKGVGSQSGTTVSQRHPHPLSAW